MDIPRPDRTKAKFRRYLITIIGAAAVITIVSVALASFRPPLPSVEARQVSIDTVKRGAMLREVRAIGVLLRPAGTSAWRVDARLATSQAHEVRVGQGARLTIGAQAVEGRVVDVQAAKQPGTSIVGLEVAGTLPPDTVPDASVEAAIELEALNDVVYVGRPGFGRENTTVGIFKLDAAGAFAARTNVKLGRTSTNAVEILEGLAPGDRVILSDMSQWPNRIRLE